MVYETRIDIHIGCECIVRHISGLVLYHLLLLQEPVSGVFLSGDPGECFVCRDIS